MGGKNTKIWIIAPHNPLDNSRFYGGVEVFLFELYKRLSQKHCVTCVDAASSKGEVIKSIALALKIRKLLRREQPDVLISNGLLGWSFSGIGIPRVNVYHGTYEGSRRAGNVNFLGNLQKKLVLCQLERISGMNALKIAVSNSTAEELSKYYNFSKEEIMVIEGGVDTSRFSPVSDEEEKIRLRKKYGLPADGTICVYTANLTYRKGWDVVQRLSRKFQEFHFVCTTRNFHYNNVTGFQVPHSQIHEIYQLGDIYLFPSRYDGFPLSLIEAMSCGLPFVGFPSGFCRDLKADPRFSRYIVSTEKDFSELVKTLSVDDDLRSDLSEKCRNFAECHDWNVVANKFNDAITKAITKDVFFNVNNWPPTMKKLKLSIEYAENVLLDAGCGTGWLSHIHAHNLRNVLGVDLVKDRIEISKAYRTFEICRADITLLPLRNDAFDTVICYDVLEHVPDYARALNEIKRVLKRKGRLIIAIPNKKGSYSIVYDRLIRFCKKALGWDRRYDHVHSFDQKAFLSSIEAEGLTVSKIANIEFLSPLIYNFRHHKIARMLSEFDTNLADRLPSEVVSEWVMVCQK